ncbi:MAG: carbohydrate ABC transporter permease [Chloroflexia bacterium]|nr:carbohydrate ABC transporter permease [Chloroflexia bacterium]
MLSRLPGRRRRLALSAMHRLVVAAVALLFLLPLIWAVSTSLRETGVPARAIEWIPSPVAWENYPAVFALIDVRRFALNSLFVAALAVPITIFVASTAGFAIAHVSQRWRSRLIAVSILCLMVPLTAIWLPRFILFKEAGLINQRIALVVPALMGTSPLYVLLFAWAFLRVPREVFEAARLDGAGPYRVWAEIGLPLARPVTVAVAVLSFVHYWNSFVEPLLLIRTADAMTASLGLRVLYALDRTNWPLMMAGAMLLTAPVIILFLLAQRAFQQDVRGRGVLGE